MRDVVTKDVDSKVQEARRYKMVDVIGTFEAYTSADGSLGPDLQRNFKDKEALLKWVCNSPTEPQDTFELIIMMTRLTGREIQTLALPTVIRAGIISGL